MDTTMGWVSWLIVGAVAGWLASLAMESPLGLLGDIVVGIVGALLGGFLFSAIGAPSSGGFDLWTIFVAFIGAVILLGLIRLVAGSQSV